MQRVNVAAVETKVDWDALAAELDPKSPLEIMDNVSPGMRWHTEPWPLSLPCCWHLLA